MFAFLTLVASVALSEPRTVDLDPHGVLPVILEEHAVRAPVIATSPVRVVWTEEGLCAGDDCVPATNDDGSFYVRRLGNFGVLVIPFAAEHEHTDDDGYFPPEYRVFVFSRRGLVFAAHEASDVHVHDDAVSVGLRCDQEIPAPAKPEYCGVHREVPVGRFDVRVDKNGAAVLGKSAVYGYDDGTAKVRVAVGRKHAFLFDDGVWRTRATPRTECRSILDPARADDETTSHINLCGVRVDERGHILADVDEGADWSTNRASFFRWLGGPVPEVKGSSPRAPIVVELPIAPITPSRTDTVVFQARCYRSVTADAVYGSYVALRADDGPLCPLFNARITILDDGRARIVYDGEGGEDACSILFDELSGRAPCGSEH